MKGTRLAFTAVGALALMLAVLPVSGASAAKLLELSTAGTPVANGSPGDVGLVIAECGIFSDGTVTANGAAKDTLKATSASNPECPKGVSISGIISETELGATGKAKLTGSITVTEPGPCVYVFTKFKPTFAVPGFVTLEGTSAGKLSKALSSKTCEKKSTQSYFADATSEVFGEPFEDALKS